MLFQKLDSSEVNLYRIQEGRRLQKVISESGLYKRISLKTSPTIFIGLPTADSVNVVSKAGMYTLLNRASCKGEPWFVATDVCRTLGFRSKTNGSVNVFNALRTLEAQECNTRQISVGGRANRLVSESGLYKLIVRSDKPQAKPFQNWVTGEVLPSIRKTGNYIQDEPAAKKAGKSVFDLGNLSINEVLHIAPILFYA